MTQFNIFKGGDGFETRFTYLFDSETTLLGDALMPLDIDDEGMVALRGGAPNGILTRNGATVQTSQLGILPNL